MKTVDRFKQPYYNRQAVANVNSTLYANITSAKTLTRDKDPSTLRPPSSVESRDRTMFDKSKAYSNRST